MLKSKTIITLGTYTPVSPADSTTYYFGAFGLAPTTTQGLLRRYITAPGIIRTADLVAYIPYNKSAYTNETFSVYIRVNNTTDYLISNAVELSMSGAIAVKHFSNVAMSVPVAVGDYIEIKMDTPAWATNPQNVSFEVNLAIDSF